MLYKKKTELMCVVLNFFFFFLLHNNYIMLLNISKHATVNYTYIKELNKADKNNTLLINE